MSQARKQGGVEEAKRGGKDKSGGWRFVSKIRVRGALAVWV